MVGLPSDFGFGCWWEGITTNVFTLTSITWTIAITILLYSILAWKKPLQKTLTLEIICWGIPVIATILPFLNSTYGPPAGQVKKNITRYQKGF